MNRSPCGHLQEHQRRTAEPSTTSSFCALGDCFLCRAAMRADFRDIPNSSHSHEPLNWKTNKRKRTEETKLNNYNLVRCQARYQRTVDNKLEQELFREAPTHVCHVIKNHSDTSFRIHGEFYTEQYSNIFL